MHTVVKSPGVTQLVPQDESGRYSGMYPPGAYYNPTQAGGGMSYGLTPPSSDGSDGGGWCCCCCCSPCWNREVGGPEPDMPWSSLRKRNKAKTSGGVVVVGGDFRRMGGISQEVYQKIQEVDNQTSTLTSKSQGHTHRVIDRIEFAQPRSDGTVETFVGQTIELLKRPGATLGIYIREGNGVDRSDGVFVSRLAPNGEAERSNLIHVGDEIVSVNNVDVSRMPIDDVVVVMSIPSRLVLRTKYPKSRRGMMAPSSDARIPLFKLKSASGAFNRAPSRESDVNEEPIESHTAQTSLGAAAARKPAQHDNNLDAKVPPAPTRKVEATERTPLIPSTPAGPGHMTVAAGENPRYTSPVTQYRPYRQQPTPQPDYSVVTEQPRPSGGYPADFPRNGDPSYQQPFPDAGREQLQYYSDSARMPPPRAHWRNISDSQVIRSAAFETGAHSSFADGTMDLSSLTATAHVPPRRLVPSQMSPRYVRRTESLRDRPSSMQPSTSVDYAYPQEPILSPSTSQIRPPILSPYSQEGGWKYPPSIQRLVDNFEDVTTTSSDSESGYPPSYWNSRTMHGYRGRSSDLKPALRAGLYTSNHKSNSLPRRRVGRVKWRNDVKGGSVAGSVTGEVQTSDSDGAVSAPELSLSPTLSGYPRRRFAPIQRIRTIDDIFTSEEYRAWMREPDFATSPLFERERRSREYLLRRKYGGRLHNSAENLQRSPYASDSERTPFGLSVVSERFNEDYLGDPEKYRNKARSSSLPPRKILQGVTGESLPRLSPYTPRRRRDDAKRTQSMEVSRMSAAGAVDPRHQEFSEHSSKLSGLLMLYVLEGRGLKNPSDKTNDSSSDEMYCVVELDGEHRARTSISTYEQKFAWQEVFEIDTINAKQADIFVYSWHPKYRHKLCHRGSLKLRDVLNRRDDSRGHFDSHYSEIGHKFALNLEPRGQLLLRLGFRPLAVIFRRKMATSRTAYFGIDLTTLVERENTGLEVPVLLRRIVEEVERRGVDCNGVYALCGSAIKKQELRNALEKQPLTANVSPDVVPDINVITGVVKDFLRELPEALISPGIYQMLAEAMEVCVANDMEGNARLILGVIDCLPRINKCTLMVLMDHFKCVAAHCSQNSMNPARLCVIFAPLLFCSTLDSAASSTQEPPTPLSHPLNGIGNGNGNSIDQAKRIEFLDPHLAIKALKLVLDLWPSRNSSSESSGSENSTINMTNNGERSLVEVWMEENRVRESKC